LAARIKLKYLPRKHLKAAVVDRQFFDQSKFTAHAKIDSKPPATQRKALCSATRRLVEVAY
jgi:hypothetical protein